MVGAQYLTIPSGTLPKTGWRAYPTATIAIIAAITLLIIGWQGPANKVRGLAVTLSSAKAAALDESLLQLEDELSAGQFHAVRTGLAQLPDALADSARARMLEIDLDIAGEHWPRAAALLQVQQDRAKAAMDSDWQAKLLLQETKLRQRTDISGAESSSVALAVNLRLDARRPTD